MREVGAGLLRMKTPSFPCAAVLPQNDSFKQNLLFRGGHGGRIARLVRARARGLPLWPCASLVAFLGSAGAPGCMLSRLAVYYAAWFQVPHQSLVCHKTSTTNQRRRGSLPPSRFKT